MKHCPAIVSLIAAAAAFFPATLLAQPDRASPPEVSLFSEPAPRVPDVPRRIRVGLTPREAIASLRGRPDAEPAPGVWIYWDFRGANCAAEMKEPALLVFFAAGRVSEVRYSEAPLVRAALAQHRQATAQAVAGRQ